MTTNKEIDVALFEDVKKGDTQAFRQLVEKYKDVSLSLAYSILKDRTLAEDVLQEAFMKVFHKAESFRHKSAFSSWLYRIVVNTSYNELKRNKKHLDLQDINLDEQRIYYEPPRHLKEEDQKKYVILAMDTLKPDEALVLRLFYLCDMSLKEIQEITNFGASKIKVDMHRGRRNMEIALKNMLGSQVGDLL